jgi:hypothetical protein
MVRLLGVLVVTAGLIALASANRGNRLAAKQPTPTPTGGPRLRGSETATPTPAPRTLVRVAPAFGLQFSLN